MNESYNDIYKNDIYKYVSRKTFFASLLMVCAFCLLCSLTVLLSVKESDNTVNTMTSEYVFASAPASAYMLRNSDGKVAVCDYYTSDVIEVLEVYVNTLSEEEQYELENGIWITSIAELVSTIEAYTS